MNGNQVKKILQEKGIPIAELARKLNMSRQALSSVLSNDDVKTGLLERTALIIGEPVTYFYTGESSGTAVVSGGTVNGDVTGKKEEGKAVDALVEQLDRKDRQIDRLLALLEKK